MTPMKALIALPVLAIALAGALPADALGVTKRQVQIPPESYQGQWFTTPDGCSYSRTKAPGYPTAWVLILNPHHIGQPDAGRHCAAMLTTKS